MSSNGNIDDSEIEVRYLHRTARVPIHLTPARAIGLLVGLIVLDLLFITAHLYSALPEIRALTVNHRLAILDLDVGGNLPTGYAVLKLMLGSLLALLMIFSFEPGARVPLFWYLAVALTAFLALDEMAQLHEVWTAGIAVKLFGNSEAGNRYSFATHALFFAAFYVAAFIHLPGRSKNALILLLFSGATLALAELPYELRLAFGRALFDATMGPLVDKFGQKASAVAWEEGLELVSYTLLVSGLAFAISDIQRLSVRYIYHGPD